jgi:predicted O-methyltransferase YrrM
MDARAVGERIAELLDWPSTTEPAGSFLQAFVRRPDVSDVLELGFDQGVSTAYLAGALEDKDAGFVTTIDRPASLAKRPNIEAVLRHVGVRDQVQPLVETSYNWALMRLLDRQLTDPKAGRREIDACFDFCFIDGAHSWETDALAFSLVDRLLRPDRWLVFDDLDWTFASSPSLRDSDQVAAMTDEQRQTPQIRKVVELLVSTRPDYELHYVGRYALAYKRGSGDCSHEGDLDDLVRSNESLIRELTIPRARPKPQGGRRRRMRLTRPIWRARFGRRS